VIEEGLRIESVAEDGVEVEESTTINEYRQAA
jgi:hypothetical protein